MKLIILRPRSAPCKHHRRFESTQLYLSLLLLLLAGDVELNPGPGLSSTHMDDCTAKVGCATCGMPPELTLRSRQIKSARPVRSTVSICAEVGCDGFVHKCKEADSTSQRSDWKCSAHRDSDPDHLQPDADLAVTDNSQLRRSPATDERYLRQPLPVGEDHLHCSNSSLPADEGHEDPVSRADEGRPRLSLPADEGHEGPASRADEGRPRLSLPADEGHEDPASRADEGRPRLSLPADEGHEGPASRADEGRPRLSLPADEGPRLPPSADEGPRLSPSANEGHQCGPASRTDEGRPRLSPPADQDTFGRPAYSPSEPLPGPSFISVSLMDVMEAVRQTQVKVDKLSEEVSRVRRVLQNMQNHDSHCREHSPTQRRPAVSEQPLPTGQRAQRQQASNSLSGGGRAELKRDAETSMLVLGDSNVRRLEQTSSSTSNVTFHSISGGTTENVRKDITQMTSRYNAKEVVIHVGTNDITRRGSEQVVKDVLDLAQNTKRQDGVKDVYICSVIPRVDRGSFIFSRSESVNNRLHSLCSKSGIGFIDLRPKLERCKFRGLLRDEVHYSNEGAKQALRVIVESANNFLV